MRPSNSGTGVALTRLLERVDDAAMVETPVDTAPTGFPSLDRVLGGGLRRGDLAVLGGDVGSGKSALALAIAIRSAATRRVVYLSGEMTPERLMERALAIEGKVRVDDLRQGTLDDASRSRVGAAALRLREAFPRIERLPSDGQNALANIVNGPRGSQFDLVIVDSIEAIGTGQRSLAEEQAHTIGALKALALDAAIPILALSQLPELSPRADRRPQLDDFGGLGAVKQQADVVAAIFRESMYDPSRDIEGATELLIRKNRNGATGYVDLYFYAQWMRFEDVLDPDR
jgi:replicative DNA helicase